MKEPGCLSVPSSSPSLNIDISVKKLVFDWDEYIRKEKKKAKFKGLPKPNGPVFFDSSDNNAPYLYQGQLRERNFKATQGARYSEFSEGEDLTRELFGDQLVLGIYENCGFPAQGKLGNIDRSKIESLEHIFTPEQINEIYSTGGERTGLPRLFSTGPDEFKFDSSGRRVYQGGWCYVENGQIYVRTQRCGESIEPESRGRDRHDPITACARKGQDKVEEGVLRIFQFFFEIPYPHNNESVLDWLQVDSKECLSYYQYHFSRDIGGYEPSGEKLIYIGTFYGCVDDLNSKFVGWVNPDKNGPRALSEDLFIRKYDGRSVYIS